MKNEVPKGEAHLHALDDIEGIIDPLEITPERFDFFYRESSLAQGLSPIAAQAMLRNAQRPDIGNHSRDGMYSIQPSMAETPNYPYQIGVPIVADGTITLSLVRPDLGRPMKIFGDIDPTTEKRLYGFLKLYRTAGLPIESTHATVYVKEGSRATTILKCFAGARVPKKRIFVSTKNYEPSVRNVTVIYHETDTPSTRERLDALGKLDRFARGPRA